METDREYERIIDELAARYAGQIPRNEVAEVVHDSRDRLAATARVDSYVAIFTHRFARDRLAALAKQRGGSAKGATSVLFVCNGNAGRSQMAAAFATAMGNGAVTAVSAGLNPMDAVLPEVRAAMTERGIELPEAFPKPVTREVTDAVDVVVGIGLDESDLPSARQVITWAIPPVVGQGPAEVRAARDDIEARVRGLVDDLADEGAANFSSGSHHASR